MIPMIPPMKLPNMKMILWKLKVDENLAYKGVYTEDDLQYFKQAIHQPLNSQSNI